MPEIKVTIAKARNIEANIRRGKQINVSIQKVNSTNTFQSVIYVGNNPNILERYRTDGTDDQVELQNAFDDIANPANQFYKYAVESISDLSFNPNPAYTETVSGFNRALAVKLTSNLVYTQRGGTVINFNSGGNSGGTFCTPFGNWGDLDNVVLNLAELDGNSTITGSDSNEHGVIWLDANSQTNSKISNVTCYVQKPHNTATAVGRFRGGSNSALKYVKNCYFGVKEARNVDALATISLNADVTLLGGDVDTTFAEGVIVDGSDNLNVLGKLTLKNCYETGLRISDNFSALTNKDVKVNGNILIDNSRLHGVLLSGVKRGIFNGLIIKNSGKNSLRLTNEGGNSCEHLTFSNCKFINANLLGAVASSDEASFVYLNACDDIIFDSTCQFYDDQVVPTTARVANYNNATNVHFAGCYTNTDNLLSASPFSGANNSTTNKITNVAGFNPDRMGFVTATTAKPTVNLKNGSKQKIIINQNTTFDATNPLPSDMIRGQELTLIFEQGGLGTYTVTINPSSNIKPKTAFTIGTGVGVLTTLSLIWVSTTAGWIEIGRS
jgi:hypothetical protein